VRRSYLDKKGRYMARRRLAWTKNNIDRLDKVVKILFDLSEYKPLTLRQVYYQLVGKGYIENTRSQYQMLSNLLKWARIDGHIDWNDIEDRVRAYHNHNGWTDKRQYINAYIESMERSYSRNLWQTQKKYVEVWIEKDALSSIFSRVCDKYGVSVVVCRGFSSVSFLHDFKVRLVNHKGKKSVMLYFGDFDPSGNEMLESMKITLKDEMNVNNIQFKRIALMRDDIFKYKLPNNPDALKKTDTRAKKHLEAYGELAVELDALSPEVLEKKIKDSVESEIEDIKAFNSEVSKHKIDIQEIVKLKNQITKLLV